MADEVRTSVLVDGSRIPDEDITSLALHQEIGTHHTFSIRLRQDAKSGLLNGKAKKWIGKPIVIGFDHMSDFQLMTSPVTERFKGIVTKIGITRRTGQAELIISGNSPTITLDDHPRQRSFTDMSLMEIVEKVLGEYSGGFPSGPKVSPKVKTGTIPYTVQYRENNYQFLMRKANRYGEWCYYDGMDFYFGDDPAAKGPVKLDFSHRGLLDFGISARTLPGKYKVHGYDYEKHEFNAEPAPEAVKSNDVGNAAIGMSSGQVFSVEAQHTVGYNADKAKIKELADRREQVALDEVLVATGSSRNPNVKIGTPIDVGDGEIGEKYGKFIVTSLSHEINQRGDYYNDFEAIAVEAPAPPVTSLAPPLNCELQLARVTDVADELAMGRVKVKFLWQEDSPETSPWIRVASPYTGMDKGMYIIPEVDDQVLVGFEGNHPDFPYVLSGFYHGKAKPEWFDEENRYKGFKSKGKSQLKFDDKNKSLMLYAPAEMMLMAGKKVTMQTGGKEDSEIIVNAGEGTVNINAKIININAAEKIYLRSEKEILNDSGETIVLLGTTDIVLEAGSNLVQRFTEMSSDGNEVSVNGNMGVTVTGATIKLN